MNKDKDSEKKAHPLDSDDSDVLLNNISMKLGKLSKIQSEHTDIFKQISKILSSQEKLISSVLKHLEDDDEDGEYIFRQAIATTVISDNIWDMYALVGHPGKDLLIINDGKVTIQVGYNITASIIDSNLPTAIARFFPIFPGARFKSSGDTRVIKNVYIRTDAGTSAYRMWIAW